MYLVSIYFDAGTDQKIRKMMKQSADKSGNFCMIDNNVPPHITLSAFESRCEQEIIEKLDGVAAELKKGNLQWVSVGQFMPGVVFLSAVLNEYLHKLSTAVYEGIKDIRDISVSRFYRPFQWMPHTTIAKKLTKEEMNAICMVLQNQFGMFQGQVIRIGIAKTNPYRDIKVWDLL